MQEEIWKDVIGFEDRYSVSSFGRVYSKFSKKMLKLRVNLGGYNYFMAKRNGEVKNLLVHRQVALCFLPPPSESLVEKCKNEHHGVVLVNHIDGNKLNNNYLNLEWTDSQQNMRHAFDTGLCSNPSGAAGIKNFKSVIKDVDTLNAIRAEPFEKWKRGCSIKDIAQKYGISVSVARGILNNISYIE